MSKDAATTAEPKEPRAAKAPKAPKKAKGKGGSPAKPVRSPRVRATAAPAVPESDAEAKELAREFAKKWQGWETDTVPVDSIKVEDRYRKKLDPKEDARLMESISKFGCLQPILIRKSDRRLIAGGRRLKAHQDLGLKNINAVLVDDFGSLDPEIAVLQMEIEENTQRADVGNRERLDRIKQIKALFDKQPKAPKGAGQVKKEATVKATGASLEFARQAKVVEQAAAADPERYGPIKARMDADETTVKGAYTEVVRLKKAELDGAGVPLADKAAQKFLECGFFDEAIKAAQKLMKDVSQICSRPGGERLVRSGLFTVKGTERPEYHFTGLVSLIDALKKGRPHVQCPVCYDAHKELGRYDRGCRACGGAGHIGEDVWKNLVSTDDPAVKKFTKLKVEPGGTPVATEPEPARA